MANHYFQFKQFTISQDRCALKVCTDACILGAYFAPMTPPHGRILDIGSGTGLLMLQLAQQHNGSIHGIELDPDAFGQARENIGQTKWNDRLEIFHGDVRTFAFPHRYDFIITNPPFFEGDLTASSRSRNLAKHSEELTLAELLTAIDTNLESSGSFGILLPYHRMASFEALAKGHHFYVRERLLVKQTPRHDHFRAILRLSREQGLQAPDMTLTIKEDTGEYSAGFVRLLKDYYLYL
jgi:tRNA1Val (adenine37-N6)-methyltransferase